MDLTIRRILSTKDDEVLYKLLAAELSRRIPSYKGADDLFEKIQPLPIGLRAMAATYQLDVSMALDDLGWHFWNWASQDLSKVTLWGLKELGATKEAEIFEEAFNIALPFWHFIVASPNFIEWYSDSELEKALDPLNEKMWELMAYHGNTGTDLLSRWAPYARKYPDNICSK
jgi:hypothetical protein